MGRGLKVLIIGGGGESTQSRQLMREVLKLKKLLFLQEMIL